jgi:predicted DNA-binding transcriptional regulator AlpA
MRALSVRHHKIMVSTTPGFMTSGQVVEYFSTSPSWILRRQADSGFPMPTPLGGRLRLWRKADVESWAAARAVRS